LGKRVTEVFPSVEKMGLLDVFRRVYHSGISERLPVTYYSDNRVSGWREGVIIPLPSGMVAAIYRNVTAEVNAIRSLEAMHQYVLKISQAETLREIGRHVFEAIEKVLGFSIGNFAILNREQLVNVFVRGINGKFPLNISLKGPGVMAWAVRTGETQYVPDTRLDKNYLRGESKESHLLRSELAVSVKGKDSVRAVINVESTKLDAFSEANRLFVETLARHVGTAIERLERLSKAMTEMNEAESVEDLSEITLRLAEEIIGASYISFAVLENDTLKTVQTRGAPQIGLDLPLDGRGITVRAIRERRTVLVDDTRLDPDFLKGSTDSLSELVVPLLVEGKAVGVINSESRKVRFFDKHHVSLMEALAAHTASNLERLRRTREAEEARLHARVQEVRAEESERLNKVKTHFINTAIHELRTPLTSIMGYLELIEEEEPLTENQHKYLNVISRNAQRLKKLTEDLLDQQRIDSGRMVIDKKPLNPASLVEQVAAEMTPILGVRNQRLVIETPAKSLTVMGDEVRLGQVLVNLLSNASKYSPEGSEVMLKIIDRGDEVQFTVVDHGVGINENDLQKLFKPFPGIHMPGVKDSTGLGLSICKGIVDLHGGRIWAESMGPGKGSTFSFTIPKKKGTKIRKTS